MTLRHELLDTIPVVEMMEEGVLYISVKFGIVSHRCCCGCGTEIVTPISPEDWRLTFHGKTFSLFPSVGNWSLPCRSHYVIRESRVLWEGDFSKNEFVIWREEDDLRKLPPRRVVVANEEKHAPSFLQRLKDWIGSRFRRKGQSP